MPVPTEGKLHHLLGEEITMTPDNFKTWRTDLGLTQAAAAEALGMSRSSLVNYEKGERREDGRPVEIPKTVALACAAIRAGLNPEGSASS